MRIAGDVNFEVRSHDDVRKAFEEMADLTFTAIPATSEKPFTLKIMFDAESA